MSKIRFSILGDSISTLEGYIPEGHKIYYTSDIEKYTGISTPDDTWWGQVVSHFGGEILVNNSWSGSLVTPTPDKEARSYGISSERTGGLGSDGRIPDIILIYMGTNDRGHDIDFSEFEKNYKYMICEIQKNYPNARLWCITPGRSRRSRDLTSVFPLYIDSEKSRDYCEIIKKIAGKHKLGCIDLHSVEAYDTVDGLHPTHEGMRIISGAVISEMDKTF